MTTQSELLHTVYKPTMVVGKWYGRVRGAAMPMIELGNWTQADIEQQMDEDRTPDMTQLGGGTYAKVSRVKSIALKAKVTDLNLTLLSRHLRGTVTSIPAGNVLSADITLYPGGLTPLPNLNVTSVEIKASAGGAVIPAAGNYEVRPEGIYVLPESTAIAGATTATISYSYPEQVVLDPLTTPVVELEMLFAGLNEADSGRPEVLEVFRAQTDILAKWPQISNKLQELDVSFELLTDPTKTGSGVSRYYRKRYV